MRSLFLACAVRRRHQRGDHPLAHRQCADLRLLGGPEGRGSVSDDTGWFPRRAHLRRHNDLLGHRSSSRRWRCSWRRRWDSERRSTSPSTRAAGSRWLQADPRDPRGHPQRGDRVLRSYLHQPQPDPVDFPRSGDLQHAGRRHRGRHPGDAARSIDGGRLPVRRARHPREASFGLGAPEGTRPPRGCPGGHLGIVASVILGRLACDRGDNGRDDRRRSDRWLRSSGQPARAAGRR